MVFEVIQGHLILKLGVFGVIWGQNSNIFKPRQIIHQNEALGPVIKKKWFSWSSEVIWLQNKDPLGSFEVKIQRFSNFDPVSTKKGGGQKIASSEARGYQEKTGQAKTSSEARGWEEETVPQIASSEARC